MAATTANRLDGVMRLATERKYGNRHTEIDNIVFDSRHEAAVYQSLKLRQCSGDITNLSMQVPFTLQDAFVDSSGKRHRAIVYVADFCHYEGQQRVVTDAKGIETGIFKIKRKLFLKRYPDVRFDVVKRESR